MASPERPFTSIYQWCSAGFAISDNAFEPLCVTYFAVSSASAFLLFSSSAPWPLQRSQGATQDSPGAPKGPPGVAKPSHGVCKARERTSKQPPRGLQEPQRPAKDLPRDAQEELLSLPQGGTRSSHHGRNLRLLSDLYKRFISGVLQSLHFPNMRLSLCV